MANVFTLFKDGSLYWAYPIVGGKKVMLGNPLETREFLNSVRDNTVTQYFQAELENAPFRHNWQADRDAVVQGLDVGDSFIMQNTKLFDLSQYPGRTLEEAVTDQTLTYENKTFAQVLSEIELA